MRIVNAGRISSREKQLRSETPSQIDEHLVTLRDRFSPQVEQYKALHYALEEASVSDRPHVVAITSAAAKDGKTTTAINLAGVLAHRQDARVLLIDADLRRPSVAALLGLGDHGSSVGLVDVIRDPGLTLDRAAIRLPAFNLSILTAGSVADDPFELLRVPRMGGVLQEARRQFDYVVIDTAPLLCVPDARALETCVDGFVMVVAAHRTPRKLVGEALDLLNPSKLIGVIFNRDDRPLSRHYGDYYGHDVRRQRGGSAE